MEEMNFNTQHDFKDIVSVDKLFKVFFLYIELWSENEEKNFIIYPCIKIFCYLWCFNGFQGRFDYDRNIIK